MPALTKPNTAVTVSIIANFLPTPRRTKRLRPCTVKKIQSPPTRSGRSEVLPQHTVRKRDRKARISTGSVATIDSPRGGSPHFRRLRVALSSPSDAEVGCIGVVGCALAAFLGSAAGWNGNLGRWGFGGQIRFSG